MRISDWSSDVCSSDLGNGNPFPSPPSRSGTALFGRRLGGSSDHADVGAVAGLAELHPALGDGADRVIPAAADILARMHLGAALADDDVPGDDGLDPAPLHAAATALGVAPVVGAAARTGHRRSGYAG